MDEAGLIRCEVVYALADRQYVVALRLPPGATARDAVLQALKEGLGDVCAGMDLERVSLGVFGRTVPFEQRLEEGDRVEIYRPLLMDPRAARRARIGPRSRS